MAPLASPPLPSRAPAFLAAPAIRSGRPPRLLSPSRSASPLLSSGCAGCFPRAPRAPCTAARERRRDAVRVRLPIPVSSSMQCLSCCGARDLCCCACANRVCGVRSCRYELEMDARAHDGSATLQVIHTTDMIPVLVRHTSTFRNNAAVSSRSDD